MMTEIIVNHSDLEIDLTGLDLFLSDALNEISGASGRSAEVSIISDKKMRAINKEFRGFDSTTDVLSFPMENEEFDDPSQLGEILISAEQARKQAAENHLTFETEIKQLILHGILHLRGYDHETDNGEMNSLELELRDKLGINQ